MQFETIRSLSFPRSNRIKPRSPFLQNFHPLHCNNNNSYSSWIFLSWNFAKRGKREITSRNGNHLKISQFFPSTKSQNLSKILNTSVLLSNFPPLWTIVPFDSDRARRSLLINDISKYISNLFIDPTREIVCAWWVKHHREEGGGQQFINSPCARRKFARHPVLKVAPCESCEAKES